MIWKDLLYFQKGSRIAVIILLILIMLTLIFTTIISSGNSSEIALQQNDSIISEFNKFRNQLKERDSINYSENSIEQKDPYNLQQKGIYKLSKNDQNIRDSHKSSRTNSNFSKTTKLSAGETISLNTTDTAQWKMVPGIGSAYSSRIIKYRALLGGFVHKEQLMEVYGIDSEMYSLISPYIDEDSNYTKLRINDLEFRDLLRHPYLNYEQVIAIFNLRDKKGKVDSINELSMLEEFTAEDISRLEPYLDFKSQNFTQIE